jgi:hypothetical protein
MPLVLRSCDCPSNVSWPAPLAIAPLHHRKVGPFCQTGENFHGLKCREPAPSDLPASWQKKVKIGEPIPQMPVYLNKPDETSQSTTP